MTTKSGITQMREWLEKIDQNVMSFPAHYAVKARELEAAELAQKSLYDNDGYCRICAKHMGTHSEPCKERAQKQECTLTDKDIQIEDLEQRITIFKARIAQVEKEKQEADNELLSLRHRVDMYAQIIEKQEAPASSLLESGRCKYQEDNKNCTAKHCPYHDIRCTTSDGTCIINPKPIITDGKLRAKMAAIVFHADGRPLTEEENIKICDLALIPNHTHTGGKV